MKKNILPVVVIFIASLFLNGNCKGPYIAEYKNVKGFVVAKENCNLSEDLDYWIIDLTFLPNTPQFGDSISLNGTTYKNAVKTKDLNSQLKKIGLPVSIDYKSFSNEKIITAGCTIITPQTYTLKEMYILNQGEIR